MLRPCFYVWDFWPDALLRIMLGVDCAWALNARFMVAAFV